jgi:hypothetical protein
MSKTAKLNLLQAELDWACAGTVQEIQCKLPSTLISRYKNKQETL